jgi:hypothetical protein
MTDGTAKASERAGSTPKPETILVFAPENIGSIAVLRQADDTDAGHAARQNMYAKLLKV